MIDKLISELTQEKTDSKSILKEFGENGKFKVYDIYSGAMIMLHNILQQEGDIDINSPDVVRLLFMIFTNFEEIDPKLLDKDVFERLMLKPNNFMKQMINEVLNISNKALEQYIEAFKTYNELPEDQKEEVVKFFNGMFNSGAK